MSIQSMSSPPIREKTIHFSSLFSPPTPTYFLLRHHIFRYSVVVLTIKGYKGGSCDRLPYTFTHNHFNFSLYKPQNVDVRMKNKEDVAICVGLL